MNKCICIFTCLVLLFSCPLTSEARGGFNGIITQIKDPKAMEAYAKEIQQLTELYEQGKKMQTQINQLQQSLEHFNFSDLESTYNMLTGTMNDFEDIQKQYIGMNITAQEMKDNWDKLNEDYDSKNMTPDEYEKLKAKQEERRKVSAEYRAKLLSRLEDTEKVRAEANQWKEELMKLDGKNVKSSPVKAIQILGQLMTLQANELKKSQKVITEDMRARDQKALDEQQAKKIEEAKTKHEASLQEQSLKEASKEEHRVKYRSAIMTHDEYLAANNIVGE